MSFFGSVFNKNKDEGEYDKTYSQYNKDEGEQPFSSTIDTDSQSEQKAPKQEANTRRISRPATPKRTNGNLKKWLLWCPIALCSTHCCGIYHKKDSRKKGEQTDHY